jgi:hypothetical protein
VHSAIKFSDTLSHSCPPPDNSFLLFNYNSWGVSVMEDEVGAGQLLLASGKLFITALALLARSMMVGMSALQPTAEAQLGQLLVQQKLDWSG